MVALRDAEASRLTTPMPVELDPELESQVDWFLQRMHQSFSKKVGDLVSFVCGHTLTQSVLDALPGSALSWFFNDSPLVMDPSRVLYNQGNIDITDLTPGDTGVYTCSVQWGPEKAKQNITVGVYSLEVTADSPTRYVFEMDSLRLECNSQPLGRLFPSAWRQWLFNSTIVSSPAATLAVNMSADLIPEVTKSMAGVWECQVEDNTTRTWNTAWYNISVENAPSFLARAYVTLKYHIFIVIIVSAILLLVCCVCFCYSVFKMKEKEDETDKEFISTRNGWEKTFNDYAAGGKVSIKDSDLPPNLGANDENEEDTKDGEQEIKQSELEIAISEEENEEDKENNGKLDEKSEVDKEGENNLNKSASKLRQKRTNRAREGFRNLTENKRDKEIINSEKKSKQRPNEIRRDINAKDREAPVRSEILKVLTSGMRRKMKHKVVHPQVSKENAYQWLLKNSSNIRKIDALLKEKVHMTRSDRMSELALHNSRKVTTTIPGHISRLLSSSGESIRTNVHDKPARVYEPFGLVTKGKMFSHETIAPAHTGIRLEAAPLSEIGGTQRLNREVKMSQQISSNLACEAESHPGHRSSRKLSRPTSVKSWLARGRERLGGWTAKTSKWDHNDIRYNVLPQVDESDFMEL